MIKVKFVGGIKPNSTKEIWGGSKATFNSMIKSLENSKEINFIYRTRIDFKTFKEFKDFLDDGDISHVDDTGVITQMFIEGSDPPDIIGPIVRSPIKRYKGWECLYTPEWFYKARVIRLNYNEERKNHELVSLIRHGVDINYLIPTNKKKKYVLWAGNKNRYAKNYPLMEQIMNMKLPRGYKFKIMHNYNVEDYWKVLDNTAILVNTSRYESFCCALFEARAKGVATIQPIGLNGYGVHENAPVQIEYNVEAYQKKILELLENKNYEKVGKKCREYCVNNASLEIMGEDLTKIYKEVYNEKRKSKFYKKLF